MDFRTNARFFGQQRLDAQSTGLNDLITPYYPRIPDLGLAAWCFFNKAGDRRSSCESCRRTHEDQQ